MIKLPCCERSIKGKNKFLSIFFTLATTFSESNRTKMLKNTWQIWLLFVILIVVIHEIITS